jgi:anti-anti-sigma factor
MINAAMPDGARMDMNVTDTADGVTHVALDGRFDIAGAQEVDSRFAELAQRAKILVIDLAKVSFLASLGVRTLMVSAKTMIRRGAYIAVCGADENVEKVLRLTGFDEIVGLYRDDPAAAASLTMRAKEFESRKA